MKRTAVIVGAAAFIVGIALAAGQTASALVVTGFFDDDNGHLFEREIDAIAAANITKGCNPPANTNFCPDDDVTRGEMAAFMKRALALPSSSQDFFDDDNGSIFESDINAIAAAGITKGCNPPANTRFCPADDVTRGAMAAFLRRALQLPATTTDFFDDDDNSVFESDINAIAAAGITKGCNPPANDEFCPGRDVTRGEMAAFLKRAFGLPLHLRVLPLADLAEISCSKDGERCSFVAYVSPGITYTIEEGVYQIAAASTEELSEFNSGSTRFEMELDGSPQNVQELPQSGTTLLERTWRTQVQFDGSPQTLKATWRWNGGRIQVTTVTIIPLS